jgi:hypothetical protein
MSEYVRINTSIPEILAAANDIVSEGSDMETKMSPLISAITAHEGTPVWGNDEFSTKFLANYHGDGDKHMSDVVKDMAQGDNSVGSVAQTIGGIVVNAMFNYSDSDTGASKDIDATE